MTQTFRRHGVVVTGPRKVQPDFTGVSKAELEHLLARIPRYGSDFRLEYKSYPGYVQLVPEDDNLWRFRLGYGFHYYAAEMIPSPSAYTTIDSALDAAIKLFIEGRKLSKGKSQRDASPMRVAQAEKEKRKRRK